MADLKNKCLCFSQIAQGNKDAFNIFFEHYYPKLILFAKSFVTCPKQAEDVVADVLTNLLIHRERVFVLDHFESYLYASIKNKALNSLKKQKTIDLYTEGLKDSNPFSKTSADPYELLVEKDLRTVIQTIIKKFPAKRKLVFRLIREEGLSYRQVAHQLNISERTVEVHLKLAVKSLRVSVQQYLDAKKAKKGVMDLVKILSPVLHLCF